MKNESENAESTRDFRSRIYQEYVTARNERLAPTDIVGLGPRLPLLRRVVREFFPRDRSAAILELGCGHGALIHVARAEGYGNLVGYDRSPDQVRAAQELGIGGVHLGDLRNVIEETAPESLDAVVTFDVIEHLRKDELLEVVDAVYRCLRPGGRWIIHAPNGESPFGARQRYWDFTHETAFTRESITLLMRASGFARVATLEDGPIAHGLKSTARWILWKAIRGLLRVYLVAETGTAAGAVFTQNFFVIVEK